MREQKPSVNSHLPDDTVLEILARLPVKSLLRFRCVCKSWDSDFSSPYFIAVHLKNSQDYLLYFPRKNERQICTVASNCTYDRIFEFGIPFAFPSGFAQIVGSCNGLICFKDIRRYMSPDLIYLWNPSIRKFKMWPSPSFSGLRWVAYGFAYDHSVNDDYKIVRISFFSIKPDGYNEIETSPHRAEVYTLRSDSWRSVDGIPLKPDVRVSYQWDSLPAPLVGGALHWMLETGEADYNGEKWREMIMSFDVGTDKFGEIELPPGRSDQFYRCEENLGEYKGKLALFYIDYHLDGQGTKCSIWVMNDYGLAESWTESIVVRFHREYVSLFGCTENGALVIYKPPDVLTERCWKIVIFDPETSYEKNLDIRHHPLIVTTFKESLVSLYGTNVYDQDSN